MRVLLLSLVIVASGCGPAVNTAMLSSGPPIPPTAEIRVIPVYELPPDNAVMLGKVKVGDSGFSTNCNYETAIGRAKMEARKNGGNAIKLTKHTMPDFWSSCHRIEADILSLPTP